MGDLIKKSEMPHASRRKIHQRHACGQLAKLAPGIFLPRDVLEALTPWDHYQMRCSAVEFAYPKYTLVGKSAAAVWENGFPVPDLQTSIVNNSGHFLGAGGCAIPGSISNR